MKEGLDAAGGAMPPPEFRIWMEEADSRFPPPPPQPTIPKPESLPPANAEREDDLDLPIQRDREASEDPDLLRRTEAKPSGGKP